MMATAFLGFFKRSPKSLKSNNVKHERRIKLSKLGNTYSYNKQQRFYSVDCRSRDSNVSDKDSGLAIILSKLNIKYEAIYTNLHIKENRDKMSKDLRNRGIYINQIPPGRPTRSLLKKKCQIIIRMKDENLLEILI